MSDGTKRRMKIWIWWTLGAVAVLPVYFVRELIAAELILGRVFLAALLSFLAFYLLGTAGEAGLHLAESPGHVVVPAARRVIHYAQELSRKPFLRPHSGPAR